MTPDQLQALLGLLGPGAGPSQTPAPPPQAAAGMSRQPVGLLGLFGAGGAGQVPGAQPQSPQMQGTGLLSRFPAAGQMPVMRPPPTGDRMSMQPPPSGDQMPIARPAPQFMPQLSSSGGPFGSMTQAQFYQFLKQNGMLSSTPSTDPWPAM